MQLNVKVFWGVLLFVILVWPATDWAAGPAGKAPFITREVSPEPLDGRQVIQTFDFEERSVNYLDLPMYWEKVIRSGEEGFPHYASGQLDKAHARSGEYSFKLIPDGGSVGFSYDYRRMPIKPGSDFQITGYVHLESARTAKAQLSCALANRAGKIIKDTLHKSRLVGTDDLDGGGWAKIEVYVPGNVPDACYLSLGVWLLQEEQWRGNSTLDSHIFQRDVKALCWFDDISIFQLPRVILTTARPGNVFSSEETPTLKMEVDGIAMLDYNVHLTVRNMEDKIFLDKSWFLAGSKGTERNRQFELPDIPAGLYHAALTIMSEGTVIATRELTFCRLSALSGESPASGVNFGIICLDDTVGDWETAIHLTEMCNAKLLKLPVWKKRPEFGEAMFNATNVDQKLLLLQKHNIEVAATFSEIPDSLSIQMDAGRRTLLDVLSQDIQLWLPQVAVMLAQYARQVPYWQIGNEQMGTNPIWDPRTRPVMETMRGEFRKFISEPMLMAPLSSLFDVELGQVGTNYICLGIPSYIAPREIPKYLDDFHRRGFEHIWATLEPLDTSTYRREEVLSDLTQRVAYARVGKAQTIFINHPWVKREYNARTVVEPLENMLVFRTLSDQLGGTEYLGRFDIREGIPALIFDRGGKGCLLIWNENYGHNETGTSVEAELYLGDNPVAVDFFGNRKTIKTHRGVGRITITDRPILLMNIDTHIASLRSSLRLNPSTIEANISKQDTVLEFTNPFDIPITGRIRFILDEVANRNWSIDPVQINFVLQPREKFHQNLQIKFPCNELGGRKNFQVYFSLEADRSYRFQTEIPFEIQLPGINVNIFALRVNDTDLLIQQMVTNISNEEVSLSSFVDLPDGGRLERTISQLQPQGISMKMYPIRMASQWLGQYIRIGIYDPKGTRRINYQVEIN